MAAQCRQGQAHFVSHRGPVEPPTIPVSVNGRAVKCILDTGLTLDAMVRPELVKQDDYTGETVYVTYADGRGKSLPLATVQVDSDIVKGKILAAVQGQLLYPMLLGTRYVLPRLDLDVTDQQAEEPVRTTYQYVTEKKGRRKKKLEKERQEKLEKEKEARLGMEKKEKAERLERERQGVKERERQNRVRVEEVKIRQLRAAERPRTKKNVRRFLGLAGYYRQFVPNFSTVAGPLTDLLKKNSPNKVVWTEECERAFSTLKGALTSGAILKLPDLEQDFVLRTDASDIGLGAVIMQDHKGVLHPVAYASRKLNRAEKNYSVSEKECLAIVFGVSRFQRYLYGKTFILETDHEPLSYLAQAKLTSSRLMRWSLILQEYSMKLRYIPGNENTAADFMSRSMHDEEA